MFSGVTDCYQPLEASYRLTRGCLEVCVAHANPAAIITKSALIERDVDVLIELARVASAHVTVSIPFWDPGARARDRALRRDAGAPAARDRDAGAGRAIRSASTSRRSSPASTIRTFPKILTAARDAGATSGGLRAAAAARLGEAGVRGAAARRAAAGGGSGASPHPRDARRPTLRSALRRARARGGDVRRHAIQIAVRDDGGAARATNAAWAMVDDAGRRQATSKTCRTMGRPPLRSGKRAGGAQAQLTLAIEPGGRRRPRRASRESARVARVRDRGSRARRRARRPGGGRRAGS